MFLTPDSVPRTMLGAQGVATKWGGGGGAVREHVDTESQTAQLSGDWEQLAASRRSRREESV